MFKNKKKQLSDNKPVSETIYELRKTQHNGTTKVAEIIDRFKENGILLAVIFFALPAALPLPFPPGFTTILGLPIIALSIQMILGSKKVKLPKKIKQYEVQNSTLTTMSIKVTPLLKKMEKFIKPRFSFANSVYCEKILGLIILIAACAVTLPLPFTNAIPAQGVVVMALGFLNRDGLTIIAGILVTVIGLIVAGFAIYFYWSLITWFFNLFV